MFSIHTSSGSYPILFREDPFEEILNHFSENIRSGIITDTNLAVLYQKELEKIQEKYAAEVITFEASEKNKSLQTVEELAEKLQENHFGKKNTLIFALGGGIVGDTAGFLASIYMRGVPYIQVPTTLLAMVDSSIGGKTGVNTKYGKNMLGTIIPPKAVIISSFFLQSLPAKEISNGLAEMVKHAVLDSEEHFKELELNIEKILGRDSESLLNMIKKSVHVKQRHVETDETETNGIREFLNFGHTIGHAIEKASNYKISHGEAISIGMVMESEIAEKELGFKRRNDLIRILQKCRLPTELPETIQKAQLIEFMKQDKKNQNGKVAYALPKDFGSFERVTIDT